MHRSQKGFTLIELLVVIGIIGLLASAATYSIGYIRSRLRDTTRVANVRELQKALSLYQNARAQYPITSGECVTGSDVMSLALIAEKLVTRPPKDPLYVTEPNCFYYKSDDGGAYSLRYTLEINSQVGEAGEHTVAP
ncbi:type II secretion system protein [Candidatus Uhrbacteria bacterium]|nr:type II secretion system protein [Candidatus Uhrbacteria bacterium]